MFREVKKEETFPQIEERVFGLWNKDFSFKKSLDSCPATATPLSNFETNQGYKDRQDPSLTLIFPINSNEAKFKDFGHLMWMTTPWSLYSNFCIVVGSDMDYNLVGKDYEPLSRISVEFVTPDQLSRHYKIGIMGGGRMD